MAGDDVDSTGNLAEQLGSPSANGTADSNGMVERNGGSAIRAGGGVSRRLRRDARISADRRRHQRVPWTQRPAEPLVLEVQEPGQTWREVPFALVDLAAGGVGLLVAEPLDSGSLVRVTFPLPDTLDGDGAADDGTPWSALAEVVHGRDVSGQALSHLPDAAIHPHHRGARFSRLEGDAELRLLNALYGPLPAGWAIEQYRVRRRSPATAQTGARAGRSVTRRDDDLDTGVRYAVVRDGKRIARGFTSYERARSRALSLHMDEVATSERKTLR